MKTTLIYVSHTIGKTKRKYTGANGKHGFTIATEKTPREPGKYHANTGYKTLRLIIGKRLHLVKVGNLKCPYPILSDKE